MTVPELISRKHQLETEAKQLETQIRNVVADRKHRLEGEITGAVTPLIEAFVRAAGVQINSVSIDFVDVSTISSRAPKYLVGGARVSLAIDS